jgi:hypothetical protein
MPLGRGRGSGSCGRPKGARKAPGRRDTAPGRQDTSSPAPNAGTEVKKAPWSSVEVAAALGCKLEADERHSRSTRKYRENVCEEVFGAQLKKICGENGTDGRYPFPVKERPERQGGNWTMVRSIELRSKNGKAIYGKAEIALRAILNHINPLFKRLFPDGKVPSGSNPDDVFAILEYNLAIRERKITDNVVDLEGGEAELKGKGMGKGKGSKGKRKAVGDEDEDEGEDEDEDEDEGEGEDEDGDGDDKKAETCEKKKQMGGPGATDYPLACLESWVVWIHGQGEHAAPSPNERRSRTVGGFGRMPMGSIATGVRGVRRVARRRKRRSHGPSWHVHV